MTIRGRVPRNLFDVIASLLSGTQASTDSPGQVLNAVLLTVGGLTTAGLALSPNTAANVTWIAVGTGSQAFSTSLTALANEIARVPVVGLTLSGASAFVTGVLPAGSGNGWLSEMGVFGGTASSTLGSGTLYGYTAIWPPMLKTASKLLNLQWGAQ